MKRHIHQFMRARDAKFAVIDFESTGVVRGLREEPWQVGIVHITDGAVDEKNFFASLLRIGARKFNPYAPGRHEELRAELAVAPTLSEMWPHWSSYLEGRILVAHNAGTEKKFLRQAAPMHAWKMGIDTLQLTRCVWPNLPSYTLGDICEYLGIIGKIRARCPNAAWHDALFDAFACATLLEEILRLPDWGGLTLEALQNT